MSLHNIKHNGRYGVIFSRVIFTMIMFFLAIAGYIADDIQMRTESLPITIAIRSGDSIEELKPWHSNDDRWYFFLPSYASSQNTTLRPQVAGCYLQGTRLSGERSMEAIETGVEYSFVQRSIFINSKATITFLKSANVPTMYIKTATGKMDSIYQNKEHTESAIVDIYDQNGNVDYHGHGKDTIKGRGNSTWFLDKKPFKLTLSRSASLLEMESATNWILLANGYDITNLRNKLIYDFSSKIDMGGWNPQCEYVDLYLNGEYNGLYLLSEKVEVSPNRLSVADRDNDFLFEGILPGKLKEDDAAFHVSNKKWFRLDYPKECDQNAIDEIQYAVTQLDTDIRCGNLNSLDLESWVKRFLIDEVFINGDAIVSSSFYHFDSEQRKFIAGPIWDYDLSFGNEASEWTSESKKPDQIWGVRNYWYEDLYANNEFYNRSKQVYREEFLPLLKNMMEEDIPFLSDKIYDSSVCNVIRWSDMFNQANFTDLNEHIEKMTDFLCTRLSYLEPMWCSEREYKIIKWYAEDRKTIIGVTPVALGEKITELPMQDDEQKDVWFAFGDNTVFDMNQPIMEDVNLYSKTWFITGAQTDPTEVIADNSGDISNYSGLNWKGQLMEWLIADGEGFFSVMLCAVLISTAVYLICLDKKRNGEEKVDARTKISP